MHFTVPDLVALDGIRWCQRNNVAYIGTYSSNYLSESYEILFIFIGTWHSNYIEYLKYYFIEWILGPAFYRYLKGFFEQIPTVYVPTTYVLI